MEQVIDAAIQWGVPTICAALLALTGWLYAQFKALKMGMQAMMRDRIVQAYYHYIDRGWITLHGLENVEKLYIEYHRLGGNGMVTKLVEDLREMQVRDGSVQNV